MGNGKKSDGRLGIGNTTAQNQPVLVESSGISKITAGSFHTLFTKTDGSLWAMGYNGHGQLGINSTIVKHSPVQVVGTGVAKISTGMAQCFCEDGWFPLGNGR